MCQRFDLRGGDVPQQPVVLFGQRMHVDADQRHVALLHRALGGLHGLVEDVAEEAARRQSFRIVDRLDFIDAGADAPFELVGELLDKV